MSRQPRRSLTVWYMRLCALEGENVDSIGNLYDYPRETIERRKLVRQLRRTGPLSGSDMSDSSDPDLYGRLLDLERELAGNEETSRKKGS